jgi:hypothetical protein
MQIEYHPNASESQPPPRFEFCRIARELRLLEQQARRKAERIASVTLAAGWGNVALEMQRMRNRHVAGCDRCLAAESLREVA